MAGSDNNNLSENPSLRISRRDKELLERICRARGEDIKTNVLYMLGELTLV